MDYITSPHQAELNAAKIMRGWGYLDAKATTGGADGGIDVRSRGALAQVKWKSSLANRPELQALYGARGSDTTKQLFFFSSAGYSAPAIAYADDVGINLFLYESTGKVWPINRVSAPTSTQRSWTSYDYLILLQAVKNIFRILGVGPTKRRRRRRRA
jgi:hypothetical protein